METMDQQVDRHTDHLKGSCSNGAEKARFKAGAAEGREDSYFWDINVVELAGFSAQKDMVNEPERKDKGIGVLVNV